MVLRERMIFLRATCQLILGRRCHLWVLLQVLGTFTRVACMVTKCICMEGTLDRLVWPTCKFFVPFHWGETKRD